PAPLARRARRRQAPLARPAAVRSRAASIGARTALRRDDVDLLSTSGGSMNTIAVYPGSFDPITNGHLDIIERAAKVFETLVVAVLANPRKAALLDVETRIRVIRDALAESAVPSDRIEIEAFDGLTVDLCRSRGAGSI